MKIFNILNAAVIEITRKNKRYYFFLDTGSPVSFSRDLDSITNADFLLEMEFELGMQNQLFSLEALSDLFGVQLSGVLGCDFFHLFDNVKLDVSARRMDFNVADFPSDFKVELLSQNPFLVSIAVNGSLGSCLVDTGAFHCMAFDKDFSAYKVSCGWKYPSAMGEMEIDYFSDIPISIVGEMRGHYIFGIPSNGLYQAMPFPYVLGGNFLSDYICLFDMAHQQLKFCKSNSKKYLHIRPAYSLGIQANIIDKRIIVSHLLDFCDNDIAVGDEIELPNLDMANVEAANEVYNRLIYLETDEEVECLRNGRKTTFKPSPFFR